jgi:hypothetical protein
MLPIKFVDFPAVVADPADVARGTVQLDSVALDKVPPEIVGLEIVGLEIVGLEIVGLEIVPPLMTGAVKVLLVRVWTLFREI